MNDRMMREVAIARLAGLDTPHLAPPSKGRRYGSCHCCNIRTADYRVEGHVNVWPIPRYCTPCLALLADVIARKFEDGTLGAIDDHQ